MKKIVKELFCCVLLLTMIFLSGCQKSTLQQEKQVKAPDLSVPEEDAEDLNFSFDPNAAQFTITDKRTGKIWTNGLTEEYYGQAMLNDLHKRAISSLFSVTYVDSENYTASVQNTDEEMHVEYVQTKDTVTAHASVDAAGISFDVIFALKGNTLVVSVPSDSVMETQENRITALELLPFLGASIDSENGYILFPDGSGALYEFGKHDVNSASFYQKDVYGDYFYDYDKSIRDVETGVKKVMLPVFGIKQGEGAILAAVTKGQASTSIKLSPSGYIYEAARISPIFNYRYSYEMETANAGAFVILQEKTRETSDFEVQYTFLAGEDANYSGMARVYRDFLLKNGLLNKSEYTSSVSMDYLLSLQKPMMLWSENVAASTFSGGVDILKNLRENGIDNVKLNLLGWQKNGYNVYPSHFPVSGVCGGGSGLRSLLSEAEKLKGTVVINDNFFLAQNTQKGYSKRDDLAYNTKNKIYADNDEVNFLMDVRAAKNTFSGSWMNKAKDLTVNAINLDDIARTFYANGSAQNPLKRTATESELSSMLEIADKNFSYVGVSGGNLYGLKYADFLYDIPESSSRDFVFDRDVPFFQMVVHGSLSYTAEIPGNFSNDYEQTVLRWAEYGFVPYFSVSESSATALKDCYNEGVLVSSFADISAKITDTARQFEDSFASLRKVAIYSHQLKDNGLIEVRYENGTRVLINYSAEPLSDHGISVEPESFCVLTD